MFTRGRAGRAHLACIALLAAVQAGGAGAAPRVSGEAWLDGTELRARTPKGERRGQAFVGAELRAGLDDGSVALVRIESVERSDRPGFEDVFRYVVSIPTAEGRAYLCGTDDQNRPVRAVPLQGRWKTGGASGPGPVADPRAFTFACEGAALAKCVYLGYRPWRGAVRRCDAAGRCRDFPLAELHQTCTRILRADYCGDGESHTVDGMRVNLYDAAGIQTDTEDWAVEAEWTASGARCLRRTRLGEPPPPACAARLGLPECGNPRHLGAEALLITEVPPDQFR